MMFALMVPVIITGAWAEKFSFQSFVMFTVLWPFFVYYPVAHWIWNPDGWLMQQGVLDFAGGLTIHTTSGIAAVVVSMVLETRRGFHSESGIRNSHNVPLAAIGGIIIWAGWYSFNGGSALQANYQAASALLCTQISACFSTATWAVLLYVTEGTIPVTDVMGGALAGLAGITPASGYVDVVAAPFVGIASGLGSFYAGKWLKTRLKLDDVLDVFSLQAVPGMLGTLSVSLFAEKGHFPCPLPFTIEADCDTGVNGLFYGGDFGKLFLWQLIAVVVTCSWTFAMTWLLLKLMEATPRIGINITVEAEEIGLDKQDHGQVAYDFDDLDLDMDGGTLSIVMIILTLCNADCTF